MHNARRTARDLTDLAADLPADLPADLLADLLAPLGEPAVAVADPERRLLAVACADGYGEALDLGLFETGAAPRLVRRLTFGLSVNALAFHPELPLLAVGTGDYDGGHRFEGGLFLVDLDAPSRGPRALFARRTDRQVLALHWPDPQRLRLHLAPPDDEGDRAAHTEAHTVLLHRTDWTAVPSGSLTGQHLRGPRGPFPRPDGRAAARALAARLLTPPVHRHDR
ncbi:hypothetical protein [Kitasatospora sp. NPDC057198]|uniref:hypothetical protein n=1 Tax=Kitasatospora sp. NPDC057198 TaxID=3346046 RepID=UPI003629D73F